MLSTVISKNFAHNFEKKYNPKNSYRVIKFYVPRLSTTGPLKKNHLGCQKKYHIKFYKVYQSIEMPGLRHDPGLNRKRNGTVRVALYRA